MDVQASPAGRARSLGEQLPWVRGSTLDESSENVEGMVTGLGGLPVVGTSTRSSHGASLGQQEGQKLAFRRSFSAGAPGHGAPGHGACRSLPPFGFSPLLLSVCMPVLSLLCFFLLLGTSLAPSRLPSHAVLTRNCPPAPPAVSSAAGPSVSYPPPPCVTRTTQTARGLQKCAQKGTENNRPLFSLRLN